VAIFNLMEDAATAEIARSQVWQWLHNDVVLAGGTKVTHELVVQVVAEETAKLRAAFGADFDEERYEQAQALFTRVALDEDFAEFLTIVAYELVA
jgi:malate synthase